MIKIILTVTALFAIYSVIIHFWYIDIPFVFRPLISAILANLTAYIILFINYKLSEK